MRDDRTSSNLYETGQQVGSPYDQPFEGVAYNQTPLDTQATGFKKVHARGNYGQVGSGNRSRARTSQRSSAAQDAAKQALGTVGSAVGSALGTAGGAIGGALGVAKDAVVGAVSGLAGRIGVSVGRGAEQAQLAEGDYIGVGDACRVCGNPVGDTQQRCPHCGAFRKPLWRYPAFVVATVATVALVVLFSIMLNSCSSEPEPVAPATPAGQVASGEDVTGGETDADANITPASEEQIALAGAIAAAQARYESESSHRTYTIYSVAKLGQAVEAANAVYADANASADQLNAATQSLNDAVSGLAIMPGGEGYVTPSYSDLVNDPGTYFETLVVMSGTVQTLSQNGDTTTAMVSVNGDPASMVSLSYRSSELFSDAPSAGDEFLFYGTVSGTAPYTNGNGETVEVPAVVVDYATII